MVHKSNEKRPIQVSEETANGGQRAEILNDLMGLISEALPAAPGADATHVPFLEMGANSLVLMEFQRTVETRWDLEIQVTQLFEELTTVDALATFIDEKLVDRTELLSAPSVNASAAMPVPQVVDLSVESGSELEELFKRQMQVASETINGVVQQQLQFLRQMGLAPEESFRADSAPRPRAESSVGQKPATAAQKPASPRPASTGQPQKMLSALETRARGLTPRQQQHLEALIARYTARTKNSKRHAADYRPVLADSRAAVGFRFTTKEMLYPIVGSRARGARVWDVDGNEYVDITMGQGVTLFGHHPECIGAALRAEPDDVTQLGPRPPQVGEAAALICELTGMDRVTFTNTGTEAVMAALRLARAATGRDKVAMFEGAYHGHADSVMGTSTERGGRLETKPVSPGTPQGAVEDLWTLEYGSAASLDFVRAHGAELAAVIVEPVQSRRPDLQPGEFLRELREVTRTTGTVLIFDEMITGFRIHPGGAQAYFGVEADLATYGKVLGGGMPIGVVAGRGQLMDPIDGGLWQYGDTSYPEASRVVFGGTFCQHPLAMSTTLATLRYIKEQGPALQERLNERTARLAGELNAYFRVQKVPIEVVYFGSLFRFSFTENLELLFYHMMEKGVFIWEWRNYFLSTAHTEEDIDFVIRVVKESVEALRTGGFIADCGGTTDLYELNVAQRQLATLAQISPDGSMAYHVNAQLALRGAVDVRILQGALEQVIARHEALRTIVVGEQQRVLPAAEVGAALVEVDLSGEANVEEVLAAWLWEHAAHPFDLSEAPLFNVFLLKLADEYRLVLKGHHVIVDGLSMNLIVRELSALYTAGVEGVAAELEVPLQYGEYLRWQGDNVFEQARTYWLEQSLDEVPALELPADRAQPALRSYAGGRIARPIDTALSAQIKELSRSQGCTHFMTLFSAYALFLHRISAQDDLLVGIPVAGRSLPRGETLVGYCTHLLPVRSRFDAAQSFADYLKSTRGVLLCAYQHQDYPFARLIDEIGVRRDGSGAPLVSALFNLDQPGDAPSMGGLDVRWLPQPIRFAAFDIVFNFTEVDDALVLECDYNGDIFDEDTVEGYVGHFYALLQHVVAAPEMSVAAVPLLDAETRQRVLVDWNQTQRDYPEDRCLHQLFEERVGAEPQAIAIAWDGGQMSYAELNAESNRLARYLRARGVGANGDDARVGIYCERSPVVVVALLAVLKAGGAYVPLDPAYPAARLEFMLRDCGAALLLTQERLRGRLSLADDVQVVYLDERDAAYKSEDGGDLPSAATASSLAYVIYTSGSTGQPKGAMIEHRGVVNYLSWALEYYRVGEGGGSPLHSSIGFDATITSLLAPLLAGKRLWLVPTEGPEIEHIKEVLESEGDWSLLKLTPAHLELVNALIPEKSLSGLARCLVLGGEALHGRTTAPWQRGAAETRIVNEYGPTETVVGCCIYEVGDDVSETDLVPIGRPIANTHLYVLDENFQPVPVGVPGELFIGGHGVARGYLNRPELTAERFISSAQTGLVAEPYALPVERLYRSGDLVRWRADGQLLYMGRADHQVKLRGYRIELGEIEEVLMGHEVVRHCAVLVEERQRNDQRLVAYIVAAPKADLDATAVRTWLGETLPEHMLPASFVEIEQIPLTNNGKVDRAALAALAPAQASVVRRAPARNSAEEQIIGLWCEVLGVEHVGADDNFFELGGHSLLVLPLHERLEQVFAREISPVDLFRYPTVAALARHLSGDDGSSVAPLRQRKGGTRARRKSASFRPLKQNRNARD
jgi:amino acid adenylation domain-containing protein